MEQLVGDQQIEHGILRQLFLKRMPQNVRLILASTNDALPLADLAALADKIIEAHVPAVGSLVESSPSVAAIKLNPSEDAKTSAKSDLTNQVEALTKLVKELSTTVRQLQRDRSRGRSRSRNGQHKQRDPTPGDSPAEEAQYCWYHARFGAQAHRCRSPGKWPDQGNE